MDLAQFLNFTFQDFFHFVGVLILINAPLVIVERIVAQICRTRVLVAKVQANAQNVRRSGARPEDSDGI